MSGLDIPGINSVEVPSGTFGDERELEFVSAIHQTSPEIRKNGTISCSDIRAVLMSRYGVSITPELANEMARELCGAKKLPKKKKSKKEKRDSNSLSDNASQQDTGSVDPEDGQQPEDEPVEQVAFDIVQLLALLLIPEMTHMSDSDDGKQVFEMALRQILEWLPDEGAKQLIETGEASESLLRQLLIAIGDIDSATDEDTIRQMALMIREYGTFDANTLMKLVTADVSDGHSDLIDTSTFYDVFRKYCDQSDKVQHDSFKHLNIMPFVDFANEGYHSSFYNCVVWLLSILTILFFWMFVGNPWFQNDPVTGDCNSFGCIVANKITSWVITGFVVGVSGLILVFSMNYGNIAGKRQTSTLISLLVTILLCASMYVPTLIYDSNIPHTTNQFVEYRNIIPSAEFRQAAEQNGHFSVQFDFTCRKAKEFCNIQRGLQGVSLPDSQFTLSRDETNNCLAITNETQAFSYAHYCTNGECVVPNTPSNQPICSSDNDCTKFNYDGVCGKKEDKSDSEQVCCPSGRKVETGNGQVCTNQPLGYPCNTNDVCDSKQCVNGTCAVDSTKPKMSRGSSCNDNNNCTSDFCNPDGFCDVEPTLCVALPETVSVTLDKSILPSRNLTEDEFCFINGQAAALLGCDCTCFIDTFNAEGIIGVENKTEANKITTTQEKYSILEDALRGNKISQIIFFCSIPVAVILIFIQAVLYFKGNESRMRSSDGKYAAKTMLNELIQNAIDMRKNIFDDHIEGEVMRNYLLQNKKKEKLANMKWTFDSIKSRSLMVRYGIHVPARLYTVFCLQVIVLFSFIVGVFTFINNTAKRADEFLDERRLAKDLRLDIVDWIRQDSISKAATESQILDIIPQGWMIKVACLPAVFISLIIGVVTIFVLIPSYVATTFRFRRGLIATLENPEFYVLRTNSDTINQNLGNVVFSLLGTCLLSSFVIALLIFLCVWPITRNTIRDIVGIILGIVVTSVLSIGLQTVLRSRQYVALYRIQPGAANIWTIFFESWNFVLASLAIVKRIGIVFAQAFLFLSRIDVPFIHPDIGNDVVADNFRRQVLVNEAHNHPYIDRLCGIYLRRLRGGSEFGTPVGHVWRCAFVIGLCPWLISKRVNSLESQNQVMIENETMRNSSVIAAKEESFKAE